METPCPMAVFYFGSAGAAILSFAMLSWAMASCFIALCVMAPDDILSWAMELFGAAILSCDMLEWAIEDAGFCIVSCA